MIDTDALLEKDLVTLDEALKTSNDAVLMAINAITILIAVRKTTDFSYLQNFCTVQDFWLFRYLLINLVLLILHHLTGKESKASRGGT